MSTVLKRHSRGIFTASQGWLLWLSTLRSDGSWNSKAGDWTLKRQPKALKSKLTQGWPLGLSPLRSDGSSDGQAGGWNAREVSKGDQERVRKNSRKPRDLVRNWPSDSLKKIQLTLSQGNKQKRDEVDDEDDDDAVRTSVSQDTVTVTMFT